MQLYIDLALNDYYENVSSLRRCCVCCILRPASCLRSMSALAMSDIVQLSVSGCPACRMSNSSCGVCAQGKEVQNASWCIRFVLREMRKHI